MLQLPGWCLHAYPPAASRLRRFPRPRPCKIGFPPPVCHVFRVQEKQEREKDLYLELVFTTRKLQLLHMYSRNDNYYVN